MPGLVIKVSEPLVTSASIRSTGWVITASVKSRRTEPLATRISIRLGTTQRPSLLALLPPHSMRTRSFGSATMASPGLAGRSSVSAVSSP
jgi:hypothetical protein